MGQIKEALMAVRDLLSDQSKWTQRTLARDGMGSPTYADSPVAVCWCLDGAVVKVTSGTSKLFYHTVAKFLNDVCKLVNPRFKSYVELNDYGSHRDVICLLDEAIARA